ncbi:MAG: hypothetical protein ACO3RW_07245 [Burkholderiaceae bacterium]
MTAPGDFSSGDVLTAADMNALPGGIVDVSRTATGGSTSVGTTLVDLGPSITFTAQANRYYRALGMIAVFDRSTAGYLVMEIDLDGSSVQSAFAYSSGSGYYEHVTAFYVFSTTAASHTIKLRAKTNTGTATVYNGSIERVALVLEDMGPV